MPKASSLYLASATIKKTLPTSPHLKKTNIEEMPSVQYAVSSSTNTSVGSLQRLVNSLLFGTMWLMFLFKMTRFCHIPQGIMLQLICQISLMQCNVMYCNVMYVMFLSIQRTADIDQVFFSLFQTIYPTQSLDLQTIHTHISLPHIYILRGIFPFLSLVLHLWIAAQISDFFSNLKNKINWKQNGSLILKSG